MEQTKKPSTLKAVLMCILACLVGGLVFGIIYYIGYYIYYITVLEIVFGVLAFLKFKQSTSKGNIAISMVLSIIFVIVFNFLSVFLCDVLFSANQYGISFNEALNIWIELWQTDQEIMAYFNQRLIEIAGMALIGCIFAIFMVIANVKKKKQQAPNFQTTAEPDQSDMTSFSNDNTTFQNQSLKPENQEDFTTAPTQTETKILAQKTYFEYYSQCKQFVNAYLLSKDMTAFKEQIDSLKQRATNLEPDIKEIVKSIITSEKSIPNISSTEQKTLQILERIFA